MLHIMNISLEQLQSGLEIVSRNPVVFDFEGPTTFVVWSFHPFESRWFVAGKGTSSAVSYESTYIPRSPDTEQTIRTKVARNSIERAADQRAATQNRVDLLALAHSNSSQTVATSTGHEHTRDAVVS